MAIPHEPYLDQVHQSRRTARWVLIAAAVSWWTGCAVIVACLIAAVGFGVSLVETLDVILAIGAGSLLGGLGLYATSRSLGIAASRLEIDIATKLSKSA